MSVVAAWSGRGCSDGEECGGQCARDGAVAAAVDDRSVAAQRGARERKSTSVGGEPEAETQGVER